MTLNLNPAQRGIMVIAALLIILLFFYPPWCEIKISHGKKVQSIGNHTWVGSPPKVSPRSPLHNTLAARQDAKWEETQFLTAVDTGLLGQQILIVLGSAALLLVASHGWRRRRET